MSRVTKHRGAPAFKGVIPNIRGLTYPPQQPGLQTIGPPAAPPWLAVMRVKSIGNEYLVCEGWDPIIHGYVKTVNVAKPFLLRDAASDYGGEFVEQIRYPDYTEDVARVGIQERTVVFDDLGSNAYTQKVSPPYFVGELLVAARITNTSGYSSVSPRTDGSHVQQKPTEVAAPAEWPMLPLKDSSGQFVFWMDMNIAGRRWEGVGGRALATSIWSGYLAASQIILGDDPAIAANISWTQYNAKSNGITHSTDSLTLKKGGWYDLYLTPLIANSVAQIVFTIRLKLDGDAFWTIEVDETITSGPKGEGYGCHFEASIGDVLTVAVTNDDDTNAITLIGDADDNEPRCHLSVAERP